MRAMNSMYIAGQQAQSGIEEGITKRSPLKSIWIDMEELVETIFFVLSDRASMMTGSAILIDGGALLY